MGDSGDEQDPTIQYDWQRGTSAEVRAAIEKRRQQLLTCDLETNDDARTEWLALIQERNLLAVMDIQESKEARMDELVDDLPLCGWLSKRGTKFPYKWAQRWFQYDDATGKLEFYRSKESTKKAPLGAIDLGQMTKIRIDDASGKKFTLVCPNKEWHLSAADQERMTLWMDEILLRQEKLKQKRSAGTLYSYAGTDDDDDYDDDDLSTPQVEQQEHNTPGEGAPRSDGVAKGLAKRKSILEDTYDPIQSSVTADVVDLLHAEGEGDTLSHNKDSSAVDGSKSSATRVEYVCDPKILQKCQKLQEKNKKIQEENAMLRSTVGSFQQDLVTRERELNLKDQIISQMKIKLKEEKEALEKQMRDGISIEELSARLAWSQIDLAHSRSLLDLSNHRLAGAMVMVAMYKAMSGGDFIPEEVLDEQWETMVESMSKSLQNAELRNEALQQRVQELEKKLAMQS